MLESQSSSLEANAGLNAIGSDAVPYLAQALSTKRTPYDRYPFLRRPRLQTLFTRLKCPLTWRTPSQQIRLAATWSLLAFDTQARPALRQLHAELLRPDAANRQMIIVTLSELGPLPESIPVLVQAWPLARGEEWVVRHTLLNALAEGGTNAAIKAMPLAISALQDPEPMVQAMAARALDRWGQPAPLAIPALVSLLSNSNPLIASAAAGALGRVSNGAAGAIPALHRLADSNDYAKAVATVTLWRLGEDDQTAKRILVKLLASREGKSAAAVSLGSMGAVASDAVPYLLQASHQDLSQGDIYARAQCAQAVLRIKGESAEATAVIEEALAFPGNSWVRATVAKEIGNLGPPGKALTGALTRSLRDSNRRVRHNATNSLAKLQAMGGLR